MTFQNVKGMNVVFFFCSGQTYHGKLTAGSQIRTSDHKTCEIFVVLYLQKYQT